MKDEQCGRPKDGDIILHCGHTDAMGQLNIFLADRSVVVMYQSSDGMIGEAKWIGLCSKCLEGDQDPVTKIRAGGRWREQLLN